MGLIRRLKRITMARIEAFLESIETPERVLPQLVEELAGAVREAANAEAKALSAVKAAQRRLDQAVGKAARMQETARLALEIDQDVDTARRALAAQIDADRDAAARRDGLARAEEAYRDAAGVRAQIQAQLGELKARGDAILARGRVTRIRRQAQGLDGRGPARDGNLLDTIARLEAAVEADVLEADATGAAARRLHGEDLGAQIDRLDRDAEIDRRLADMKRKTGQ